MGLKDHLEDETGHILILGLDLDYLHVESTNRQASLSATSVPDLRALQIVETDGVDTHNSSSTCNTSTSSSSSSIGNSSTGSSISGFSNCSEESATSDSEDERVQNGPVSAGQTTPPHPARQDLAQNQSSGDLPPLTDPLTDHRAKLEFALKLGYSEELVVLVLRKLGQEALINDILGELVKLGTKSEMEQAEMPARSPSSLSSSAHSASTSSLDSCRLLCASQLLDDKDNLRPVVVDGSNVAMSHGNKEVFSCHGIQLAVDWFLERGHRDITVFVPAWRKEQSRPDALITDQEILRRLEKDKILVFTPSRRVQGRRVVCYDDRFIVKLAYESDGIIVSNDNYRDLANEKPEWKKFVDERLLMYSFVNDKFMPPDDPLGRHGPSLENFLRKRPVVPEYRKQPCPYGKKCTYGHKCKFYHPERGSQPQRSVADELRASAKNSLTSSKTPSDALTVKSQSVPNNSSSTPRLEGLVTDARRCLPKRLSEPSLHGDYYTDLLEDRLGVRSKAEARRGSSSSSGSCSSIFSPPVGGPPSSHTYQQEWRSDQSLSRVSGSIGLGPAETYPTCESPELGYSSLMRAYSSLSLVAPRSPERYVPADLRMSSFVSDCSSEGSVSSESFSPDPLQEEGLKCHYNHPSNPHYQPHRHHHCLSRYPHLPSQAPPGLGPLPYHGYPLPQASGRPQHNFGLEDSPSLNHFKSQMAYLPVHLPHPSMGTRSGGGCSEGYPAPPLSPFKSHTQSSPQGSRWQDSGVQEPRLRERSPLLPPRRGYPGQEQPRLTSWDSSYYQQPPPSSYEPFTFQSLPEGREQTWHSPWGATKRSPSPRGLSSHSSPPPASHHARLNHPPLAFQHPEPTALGKYQDLREKVFVNLCNIFPPELVQLVMGRNPHVTDAQQLAAAILGEKSQHGY